MCNIAGYVGTKRAAPILLEMMKKEEGFAGGYSGQAPGPQSPWTGRQC